MYKRLINQTHGDLRVKFIKCSPLNGRLERNLYDIDVASESHCPSPECIIKSFSAYIYDVWGEDGQRCCVIGERRNGLEDICASWTFHIYSFHIRRMQNHLIGLLYIPPTSIHVFSHSSDDWATITFIREKERGRPIMARETLHIHLFDLINKRHIVRRFATTSRSMLRHSFLNSVCSTLLL